MLEKMNALLVQEEGQGMVEYALIIALVAVVLIGGLQLLATDIGAVFTAIVNAI
jgi:pilus assembly protein Flp/PilA